MLMSLVNLMVGCNSDEKPTSSTATTKDGAHMNSSSTAEGFLTLDNANVILQDATIDSIAGTLTVFYSAKMNDGGWQDRTLQLRYISDSLETYSVSTRLATGQDLISVHFSFDPNDTTEMFINEWTPKDSLSISRRVVDGVIHEVYRLSDQTFSVSFTESQMTEYFSDRGRSNNHLAAEESGPTISEKVREFEEFYSEIGSLANNEDANVMSTILLADEFEPWLGDQLQVDLELGGARLDLDGLCLLASWGNYKCYFGGIANIICHVSLGVSFACLVARTIRALGLHD